MMGPFRFSESDWNAISVEWARTGRPKDEGDREVLEIICEGFVRLRPKLRRNLPTPKRARAAWHKVATAAGKLEAAIEGLRPAGAADFTLLDWFDDGHRHEWKIWLEQLSLLKRAPYAAGEIELARARTASNAADPMRDGLVKRLVTTWQGYGGRISHGEDGPLVRFLSAVMVSVGEPMTTDAVRGCVRRILEANKTQRHSSAVCRTSRAR
jgi:hypothetical protein